MDLHLRIGLLSAIQSIYFLSCIIFKLKAIYRHLRWGGVQPKFYTIMTSFTSHETYDIGVKRLATVESCTHGIGLYAVCAGVERIHTVLQYTEVQLSPAPLSAFVIIN